MIGAPMPPPMRHPRLRMVVGLIIGPIPLVAVIAIPIWRVSKHMYLTRLDDVGMLAIGGLVAGGLGLIVAVIAIITARAAIKRAPAAPAPPATVRDLVAELPAAAPVAQIAAPAVAPVPPPAAEAPAQAPPADPAPAGWLQTRCPTPGPDPLSSPVQAPAVTPAVAQLAARRPGVDDHALAVTATEALTRAAQDAVASPVAPCFDAASAGGRHVRTQALPTVPPKAFAPASIFAPPAPHVRTATPTPEPPPVAYPPTDIYPTAQPLPGGGWLLPSPWAADPGNTSGTSTPAGGETS